MNECLTTPQHEKQIGYWMSEKGQMHEMVKRVGRSIPHGGPVELFLIHASVP